MNDSFGGDAFNATSAGAGAVAEQKAEGVVPVMIRQITESAEGNFQMWGMTFGMVTVVGIVRAIDTSSTKITYLVEDHTGQIDAHYWLEEGDALKSPDVMINSYARIFGSVRQHGGKKTLMTFKMVSVGNINEVNTHLLEVLNARFKSEEFSKKGAGSAVGGSSEGYSDFSMGTTAFSVQQDGSNLGLEGKQLAVFQAIKGFPSDVGISRSELQRKFGHISKAELENILEFMINEGHIYTTTDADHFMSTDQ